MGLILLYLVLAGLSGVIFANGYTSVASLGFTYAALFTAATIAKLEKQKAHRKW